MSTYTWDFGDGGSSTDPNPVHTYEYPGWYNVTLTIIDNADGVYSTITKMMHVYVFLDEYIPRKTNKCFCLGVRNAITQNSAG